MALEPVVPGSYLLVCRKVRDAAGLVQGERDGAVLALQLFAAGTAHGHIGVAAPVEQDDGLLATVKRGLRFREQPAREKLLLPGFAELGPHVEQLDLG